MSATKSNGTLIVTILRISYHQNSCSLQEWWYSSSDFSDPITNELFMLINLELRTEFCLWNFILIEFGETVKILKPNWYFYTYLAHIFKHASSIKSKQINVQSTNRSWREKMSLGAFCWWRIVIFWWNSNHLKYLWCVRSMSTWKITWKIVNNRFQWILNRIVSWLVCQKNVDDLLSVEWQIL